MIKGTLPSKRSLFYLPIGHIGHISSIRHISPIRPMKLANPYKIPLKIIAKVLLCSSR